jgi:hypothetical protein
MNDSNKVSELCNFTTNKQTKQKMITKINIETHENKFETKVNIN